MYKMSKKEVHDIMENELRCVQTASTNRCDRDCGKCPLVMPTDQIVEAYGYVIRMLESTEVWNGMHGQIIALKGTFEKLFNDVDDEDADI